MKRDYEGMIVLDTTGHEADVDQLVQDIVGTTEEGAGRGESETTRHCYDVRIESSGGSAIDRCI